MFETQELKIEPEKPEIAFETRKLKMESNENRNDTYNQRTKKEPVKLEIIFKVDERTLVFNFGLNVSAINTKLLMLPAAFKPKSALPLIA